MRPSILIPLLPSLLLAGCATLHLNRGVPIIAKSPEGVLIRGTQGLPDLARGQQARLAGRLDDAERDLLPLAERGYPEAQLSVAAVYGQRESADAQDQAIRWYRAVLPRRPEAAIPLARAYMRRGVRTAVLEAERLLSQAERNGNEPAVGAAFLDLYGLFPLLDVNGRAPALAEAAGASESVDSRTAAISWYRTSIAAPGHARRLLELCRQNLQAIPFCFVDLATYYRYSGEREALDALVTHAIETLQRIPPTANFDSVGYDPVELPPIAGRLAVALVDQPMLQDLAEVGDELTLEAQAATEAQLAAAEDSNHAVAVPGAVPQYAQDPPVIPTTSSPSATVPGAAQPELADRLLRWMLTQRGAMPVEAAGVAVSFPYLLPDVDLEAVLKGGVSRDIPSASLYLGQLYYFDQRVPRAAALVETHLQRSLAFRETVAPAHFRLGRLYQQGYLGTPDPQKALSHFLYAARRRLTAADTHLARLFYDTPGAKINRVNSYVFARLAEEAGRPVIVHSLRGGILGAYPLLDRLRGELTAEELQRAELLYRQEREVHLVARPRVPPDLWVKDAG